ncbi:S-layer homology domain-containing protein [uncultured Veillonella sp.]|uniref:S-layer homology domain-containing protein n=1 Tax=uncultured Veillonella sp. TaxID=159268 RepID=UPI0025EAB36E|nr:S-layer homology domain-containing protein [uncultured Veillonella sp.]MDY3973075.1 S-layer homology domain-containing protein [Veillonella caviae]
MFLSKNHVRKMIALALALGVSHSFVYSATPNVTDEAEESAQAVTITKAPEKTTLSPLLSNYYTNVNTTQAMDKASRTATNEEPQSTVERNQKIFGTSPNSLSSDNSAMFEEARKYTFTDVPSDFWAATSIAVMTNKQLISGYNDGTFKPDKPITREEVAALFSNLVSEQNTVMLSSSFKDITSDRWSANAIERVARLNIISGYGDNTYRPEKFMSRQEFAVVADNYIHYLGYESDNYVNEEDIHFSDQKFVAPWAQEAVKELALLGFLNYQPHNLFNPEKYITRAEATEITYRITNSKEALHLRETILHQQIQNKTLALIEKTFGKSYVFRLHGALFWQDNKLIVAFQSGSDAKAFGAALAFSKDKDLVQNVEVRNGSLNEVELNKLQIDAAYAYNQEERAGSILAVTPNKNVNGLVVTVDQLSDVGQKNLSKQFGTKVVFALPENE